MTYLRLTSLLTLLAVSVSAQCSIQSITDVTSYGAFMQGAVEFCRPAGAMKAFQYLHQNTLQRFNLPTASGVSLSEPLQCIRYIDKIGQTNHVLWLSFDNLSQFKLETGKLYEQTELDRAWLCWRRPRQEGIPETLCLGTIRGRSVLANRPVPANIAPQLCSALPAPTGANQRGTLRHHLVSSQALGNLVTYGLLRENELSQVKSAHWELDATPHQASLRLQLQAQTNTPLHQRIATMPEPTNYWRSIPRGVPIATVFTRQNKDYDTEVAFYMEPESSQRRFSFKSFHHTDTPVQAKQTLENFAKGSTNRFVTPLTILGYKPLTFQTTTVDRKPSLQIALQKEDSIVNTLPTFGLPVTPARLLRATDNLYATVLKNSIILASGFPENLITATRSVTYPSADFRRRFRQNLPQDIPLLAAAVLQPTALLRQWVGFMPNGTSFLQKLPDSGDEVTCTLTRPSSNILQLAIYLPQTEAFAIQATFQRGANVIQEVLMTHIFQEMMRRTSSSQESTNP